MTTSPVSVQPMLIEVIITCPKKIMNAKSLPVQPESLVDCFLEDFQGNPNFRQGKGILQVGGHQEGIEFQFTVCASFYECQRACGYAGTARRLLLEGIWRKSHCLRGERYFVDRESSLRDKIPISTLLKLQRMSVCTWVCWNGPQNASYRNLKEISMFEG